VVPPHLFPGDFEPTHLATQPARDENFKDVSQHLLCEWVGSQATEPIGEPARLLTAIPDAQFSPERFALK